MSDDKPMNGEIQEMGKGSKDDMPLTPAEIAKLVGDENVRA